MVMQKEKFPRSCGPHHADSPRLSLQLEGKYCEMHRAVPLFHISSCEGERTVQYVIMPRALSLENR